MHRIYINNMSAHTTPGGRRNSSGSSRNTCESVLVCLAVVAIIRNCWLRRVRCVHASVPPACFGEHFLFPSLSSRKRWISGANYMHFRKDDQCVANVTLSSILFGQRWVSLRSVISTGFSVAARSDHRFAAYGREKGRLFIV
jgi:hypothetical protein